MNDNQHIPSGYKPSPLGIIPEDWEVTRLGDFAPLQRGFDLPTDKIVKGNYPVVYSNGILNYHHEYKVKGPGVVTGRSGTIGKVTYVESDYWPHNTSLWVTDFNNNDHRYVFYLYKYLDLSKFASGSGVPTLNRNDVHSYKIAVPPLPEQQRIVSVLSLWDTAIAKQTALIEQLTLRKRGLMQQLLTGKKRLKGFEGEWKEVRMQDLASFAGGGTPSTKRSDFWEGTIPWISSSDLVEDCLTNNESRYITEEAIANSTTQLLPSKSILIVTRVGVGKVAIAKHPICVSQDFTCLTKYDADTLFLAYSLLLTMKKKKSQSQGTSIKGISTDEISKIKLLLPSIEEQKAIASVLVNAVKEIEIQKQKLAALQEQKKGLMQVLLTGKKRIK